LHVVANYFDAFSAEIISEYKFFCAVELIGTNRGLGPAISFLFGLTTILALILQLCTQRLCLELIIVVYGSGISFVFKGIYILDIPIFSSVYA
jgi:hypothetical protein